MSSVDDILQEINWAQEALRTGDNYVIAATEEAQRIGDAAMHAADSAHKVSDLLLDTGGTDQKLLGGSEQGYESYSTAAGVLMMLSLASGNGHLGQAVEDVSAAIAAFGGEGSGRAAELFAAYHEARTRAAEAEVAIARLAGLAGRVVLELEAARIQSIAAQDSLKRYESDV